MFLAYWPTLIFVPAVLTLITTLVLVTGWFDRRDELRAAQRWARENGAVATRPPATEDPRPWRRRTSCTCSWHTVRAEVDTRTAA